jgi:hypothetical protein
VVLLVVCSLFGCLGVDMELPKLPIPDVAEGCDAGPPEQGASQDFYTAEQMQEYARQAVLMERDGVVNILDRIKPAGGRAWTAEQAACFDCLTYAIKEIMLRT